MPPRLTPAQLGRLPGEVGRPSYDRARLPVGIVHLGLGAFHRAHQALYTEDALGVASGPFGIAGVSLRSPGARDRLAPQQGLFTVAARGAAGERLRVVGCLKEVLVAPEDPAAAVRRIADPAVSIVSLTVTEKGYTHDPASGRLNTGHPDIRHDFEHPERPRSALATLVAGLGERRRRGSAAPTVLSCDNLPANGRTLRGLALAYAALRDDALARTGSFNSTLAVIGPGGDPVEVIPPEDQDGRTQLRRPMGVAADSRGNIWVANSDFMDVPCPPNIPDLGPGSDPSIALFLRDSERQPHPDSPFTGGG